MDVCVGLQAIFVAVADEISMVEFGLVAVGSQSIHSGYRHVTADQRDTGVGVGFLAFPPPPHRLLFCVGHVVPLFCTGEFTLAVKE